MFSDWSNPAYLIIWAVFGAILVLLSLLFRFLPDARRKSLALWTGFLGSIIAGSAAVLLFRMAATPPVLGVSTAREMLDHFRQASPAERMALLARLPDSGRAWHRVGRGDVVLTIVEHGVLKSTNITEVGCQLRPRKRGWPDAGVIKWVIEDGKMVKKGDLLLEIDDGDLKKELETLKSKPAKKDAEIARLRELETDIANCRIRAPREGAVKHYVSEWSARRHSPGETVYEHQWLFVIHDVSKWQVSLRIHEKEIGFVHAGQKARVHISSLPPRTLRGEVQSVGAAHRRENLFASDTKVYIALATEDKEIEGLRPGMDAEVTIEERRSNVVCLPVTALLRLGPMDHCFVKSGEGIQFHQVEIGLRDDFFVEVKGLQEGEEVLRDPRGVAMQFAEGTPP